MLHKFSFIDLPVQVEHAGVEETRLLLELTQKHDKEKSKALFRKILSSVEYKVRWLSPKWLISGQNETQNTRLGFPSLPWEVFFTPILRVCTDGKNSVVRWRP